MLLVLSKLLPLPLSLPVSLRHRSSPPGERPAQKLATQKWREVPRFGDTSLQTQCDPCYLLATRSTRPEFKMTGAVFPTGASSRLVFAANLPVQVEADSDGVDDLQLGLEGVDMLFFFADHPFEVLRVV